MTGLKDKGLYMRSANLAKLESLSEEQADQSRIDVEVLRIEVQQLDLQHRNLKCINEEYQTSLVGSASVAPQMLAHRRAFVTQLSRRLDVLKTECQRQSELLEDKKEIHQQHAAQTAAIGSMVETERESEDYLSMRHEQREQDESGASIRQFQLSEEGSDSE